MPVYYNYFKSLLNIANFAGYISTFLKQIIPDYSNDHVFVQRMPFACFCTTTNVQDKTFVRLKD